MRRKGKSRDGTSDPLDEVTDDDQKKSRVGFSVKAAERELNDPQVFARNLDNLIRMRGLTLKQTAEKVEADYQWIRRIVTRGMVRITEDNRPCLKKLARLFKIGRIEDLWNPDLIVFKVRQEGPALTAEWLEEELVPYAQKMVLLLASGEHEYLKDLIDRLYAMLRPEPAATEEEEDAE